MTSLLSIPQAAARSGLSRSLLRRYCQQGRIGSKVGGRYVIDADELDIFVKVPRPQGYPKGKPRKERSDEALHDR